MSYFDEDTPDIVLKSLFSKYDVDCSGTISASELSTLLTEDLGLSAEQGDVYALLIDRDSSGRLSFEEFKRWLNSGERLNNVTDGTRFHLMHSAVQYFRRYDTDKSGGLDRSEFAQLHRDVGGTPESLQTALDALDKDANGKISFYEFLKWLNWIKVGEF